MRQRKPMKRLVEGLLCQQTALHLKFKDQDRQLDALQIHAVPPAAPAVLAAMVLAVEGHLEVVRALFCKPARQSTRRTTAVELWLQGFYIGLLETQRGHGQP